MILSFALFSNTVDQLFPHHFEIYYLINKSSQGYQTHIRSLYSTVLEHWSCKKGKNWATVFEKMQSIKSFPFTTQTF